MIEKQRKRVEQAVTEMINDIYKSHFKKMQFDMHMCCADCCKDQRASLESVQGCIENCSIPFTKAQDYLQTELSNFQGELQTCIMKCSDDIHNRMPQNPKESELSKYQYEFENCTVQCVDKHIRLIPNMMNTIRSVLSKGPKINRI